MLRAAFTRQPRDEDLVKIDDVGGLGLAMTAAVRDGRSIVLCIVKPHDCDVVATCVYSSRAVPYVRQGGWSSRLIRFGPSLASESKSSST